MVARQHNSVAAVLNVVVQIVMWVSVVVGLLVFVFFAIGLAASLNGGEVSLGLGEALAKGVNPGTFIAALAALVVVIPGIIYICLQLRRILTTLAAGDPFVPENAPRLLRIAAAIAIMELARYAAILCLRAFVDFGEGMPGPRLSISLVAWVSAAAMLVFSQVFREGSRLREEEKMTI
ncbi:MAG: DUF2975 domain-containing protein [Pseudomonadota bacterium]